MKEESEGASLRLNIKNTKIMASGHIIYMANRRGKGGSNDRFPLLGLQNYSDGDYRKAMTNLDSVLKSRDHYSAEKRSI